MAEHAWPNRNGVYLLTWSSIIKHVHIGKPRWIQSQCFTDTCKISEMFRTNIWLPVFVLQISAHECTKTSDLFCMQYMYIYIPNITCKVSGCLSPAYGHELRPCYRTLLFLPSQRKAFFTTFRAVTFYMATKAFFQEWKHHHQCLSRFPPPTATSLKHGIIRPSALSAI